MTCFRPMQGFRAAGGGFTTNRRNSPTQVPMTVPCQKCVGCRFERSQQWAARCVQEAKVSNFSTFLTLTYEDEFLPYGGTLVKRDLSLFLKRLRKKKGAGLRYYAAGEYGDDNLRPHYHLLLFNCWFDDRLFLRKNHRGEDLFASAECRELWPWGFNVIGDVTFESAAYVARYIMKKVDGKKREEGHYLVTLPDGQTFERLPEFQTSSNGSGTGKGGIGKPYYDRYGNEVRAHDNIIIEGREIKPPRYYDKLSERNSEAHMHYVKRDRREDARLKKDDNTPERLCVKEEIMRRNLDWKKRSL